MAYVGGGRKPSQLDNLKSSGGGGDGMAACLVCSSSLFGVCNSSLESCESSGCRWGLMRAWRQKTSATPRSLSLFATYTEGSLSFETEPSNKALTKAEACSQR
ncbi:MAG: hypothetical protein ACKERG_03330 [Candidatus Hodgkinia cicadicola]